MKQIAILYSGGSDSTAAAVLMAKRFDKIHLITYKHSGLFAISNSQLNIKILKKKFGEKKFIHKILDLDILYKKVSFDKYCSNLRRYGFFLLTTCGLCKLAMHLRTLIYCVDKDVHYVADGANKHMRYFPAQMKEVIDELKSMYHRYGITYFNPVFNLDCPEEDIDWLHKLRVEKPFLARKNEKHFQKGLTASQLLFNEGLFTTANVKATKINQHAQARCFQFILFSIFLHWYYLPKYGLVKYKQMTVKFYKEKIEYFTNLIDEYLKRKKKNGLYRFVK